MAGAFFTTLDFLLVCVLSGAWLHCVRGDCRDIRSIKFYPPDNGRYLDGHVFVNISIGIHRQCEERCLLERECISINIGPRFNNKFVCELSNSDHLQHPEDLKPRHGWTFRGAENLCAINPCLNSGKCLMGYTDKKYLCVCASGFTGETCETDINECSTGSHNCSEHATCVNTAGHFNCSCKPGYIGDGYVCFDIDECNNGSHDCSENATCVNTAGHYDCSCKPGYTGDGRVCSDCSSNLHRFEKHQDLPTKAANAVEQFRIDGSVFLAFANRNDDNNSFSPDSYIYKMNDSSGKFFLFQTVATTGGRDIEYFTIADKHYIAVANIQADKKTFKLNSSIYQWDGHQFVFMQNIPTDEASGLNFFEIFSGQFLAVANTRSTKSVIYKWKGNGFEKFQEIETEQAKACTAFVINNDTFVAFANFKRFAKSTVFKWSGTEFFKLQSLQSHGAYDVKAFNTNGETFLAFANYVNPGVNGGRHNIDSFIYKWNGTRFGLFQSILTRGARAWHPFVMCRQTFLGVASYYDTSKSVIYRASGMTFIKYQEISTVASSDMTSFEYEGHTYLAVANVRNYSKRNFISTVYKWV